MGGGEFLNLLNLIDIYITMDVGHTLDLLKNVASLTHFKYHLSIADSCTYGVF